MVEEGTGGKMKQQQVHRQILKGKSETVKTIVTVYPIATGWKVVGETHVEFISRKRFSK